VIKPFYENILVNYNKAVCNGISNKPVQVSVPWIHKAKLYQNYWYVKMYFLQLVFPYSLSLSLCAYAWNSKQYYVLVTKKYVDV